MEFFFVGVCRKPCVLSLLQLGPEKIHTLTYLATVKLGLYRKGCCFVPGYDRAVWVRNGAT